MVGVKSLVQVNAPIVCETVIVGVRFTKVVFVNVVEKRFVFPEVGVAVNPAGVVTFQEIDVPETEGFGKASKLSCVPEHCAPVGAIRLPPITFTGKETVVLGQPPIPATV